MTNTPASFQAAHLRSFIAKPLTAQQTRFVEEYLVDVSARAAAERAGYNGAVGYRLLRNPAVARAVLDAQAARAARLGITADKVVSELAAVAFADIRKVMSWSFTEHSAPDPDEPPVRRYHVDVRPSHRIDDQTGAAIAEFHRYSSGAVRLRMHDKLTALAMLGRHLGVFPGLMPPRGPRPAELEPASAATRHLTLASTAAQRLTHDQGLELQTAMTTILRIAPQLLTPPADDEA